jgi:tetratricopeptide (TPR) repeat protein
MKDWLRNVLNALVSKRHTSQNEAGTFVQPSLAAALLAYKQAVEKLQQQPGELLSVLLIRDQVEHAFQHTKPSSFGHIRECIQLDEQLFALAKPSLSSLRSWRRTLHPPDGFWWWYLDRELKSLEEEEEAKQEKRNLPWFLLAGTLLLATTTLAVEIIRRLWTGAPDIGSIFGTLLVLVLTGSPLSKRGQEFVKGAVESIFHRKPRYWAQTLTATSLVGLVLMFIIWRSLPFVAGWSNTQGVKAFLAGDLTAAQSHFQRAAALNPDYVLAYHNQAYTYEVVGNRPEAIAWYQRAVQRDLNFAPAYIGLSHLYNEAGEFEEAARVALAGLQLFENYQTRPLFVADLPAEINAVLNTTMRNLATSDPQTLNRQQTELAPVIRYYLLSNLGRAYFSQKRYDRTQEALEAAIELEEDLAKISEQHGELRLAMPHYYLAQVYDRRHKPEAAKQWEDALRYLKEDNWADREWLAVVNKKVNQP